MKIQITLSTLVLSMVSVSTFAQTRQDAKFDHRPAPQSVAQATPVNTPQVAKEIQEVIMLKDATIEAISIKDEVLSVKVSGVRVGPGNPDTLTMVVPSKYASIIGSALDKNLQLEVMGVVGKDAITLKILSLKR